MPHQGPVAKGLPPLEMVGFSEGLKPYHHLKWLDQCWFETSHLKWLERAWFETILEIAGV
jgi:hypothetical protein